METLGRAAREDNMVVEGVVRNSPLVSKLNI
jgi:hypothetical protein